MLAVIYGPGGVGKTTLALRWLHDNRHEFPHGQLYANLGAFSDHGPVEPELTLEWFLVALGLPADRIPVGLPQREALYRSLIADRALAVLLDNAMSAAQVRPLLPSSPRSVALVTSRWRLAGLGLDGARFVEVDPLNETDSVELLAKVVGEQRMAAEREHAMELARLCGGMPIALSVVGARLSARPNRTVSREVVDLRDKGRLTVLSLSNDELSVRSVFDMSYETLTAEQAWFYRLCSLHPGTSFGVEAAAAITDRTVDEAALILDDLVELNLLIEIEDRRYGYHDLLREHARERAEQTDDEQVRHAAVRRMVEWYLDTTVAADLILRPTRVRVGPRFAQPPGRSPLFDTHQDVLRWLAWERDNLMQSVRSAAAHGWDDLVWEFCEALWGFMPYVSASADWVGLYQAGAAAAQRSGRTVAEARMRTMLSSVLTHRGRYDEAARESLEALRLAEHAGHQYAEAAALAEVASAAHGKGDLRTALDHLSRARRIREEIGTARSLSQCLRQIGVVLTELGRHEEATAVLINAFDAIPGTDIEQARILTCLGTAYLRWERLTEAKAPLTRALDIATSLGSAQYRADALRELGELAERTGDAADARDYFIAAQRFYAECGDPRAETLAARLSGTST